MLATGRPLKDNGVYRSNGLRGRVYLIQKGHDGLFVGHGDIDPAHAKGAETLHGRGHIFLAHGEGHIGPINAQRGRGRIVHGGAFALGKWPTYQSNQLCFTVNVHGYLSFITGHWSFVIGSL